MTQGPTRHGASVSASSIRPPTWTSRLRSEPAGGRVPGRSFRPTEKGSLQTRIPRCAEWRPARRLRASLPIIPVRVPNAVPCKTTSESRHRPKDATDDPSSVGWSMEHRTWSAPAPLRTRIVAPTLSWIQNRAMTGSHSSVEDRHQLRISITRLPSYPKK